MRVPISLIAGAALLGSGSAIAHGQADGKARAEATLAKLLEGRVAGDPVQCISLHDIHSSQIIDKTAIVYDTGRRIYVNRPTAGADILDSDDILVSKTFTDELCRVDAIRLLDRTSHFERGIVVLGAFIPYSRVQKAP